MPPANTTITQIGASKAYDDMMMYNKKNETKYSPPYNTYVWSFLLFIWSSIPRSTTHSSPSLSNVLPTKLTNRCCHLAHQLLPQHRCRCFLDQYRIFCIPSSTRNYGPCTARRTSPLAGSSEVFLQPSPSHLDNIGCKGESKKHNQYKCLSIFYTEQTKQNRNANLCLRIWRAAPGLGPGPGQQQQGHRRRAEPVQCRTYDIWCVMQS